MRIEEIKKLNEEQLRSELIKCTRIIAAFRGPEGIADIEETTYDESVMYDSDINEMVEAAYEEGWNDAVDFYKYERVIV